MNYENDALAKLLRETQVSALAVSNELSFLSYMMVSPQRSHISTFERDRVYAAYNRLTNHLRALMEEGADEHEQEEK